MPKRKSHMNYPKWAPADIVNELRKNPLEIGESDPICDMWERLVTRNEMQPFWEWIAGLEGGLPHLANGGLVGRINREVAAFHAARKLSPSEYRKEMLRITKLSKALSKEISAFRKRAFSGLDPFPFSSMLNRSDLRYVGQMVRPEFLPGPAHDGARLRRIQTLLDTALPPIDEQLLALGQYAEDESSRQFYRLRLPRKVNDKHVFRTYFVKLVIDHFFISYLDYSPARIALFCGAALDDDEIDSDMVQKHCDFDAEARAILKTAASISRER